MMATSRRCSGYRRVGSHRRREFPALRGPRSVSRGNPFLVPHFPPQAHSRAIRLNRTLADPRLLTRRGGPALRLSGTVAPGGIMLVLLPRGIRLVSRRAFPAYPSFIHRHARVHALPADVAAAVRSSRTLRGCANVAVLAVLVAVGARLRLRPPLLVPRPPFVLRIPSSPDPNPYPPPPGARL